MHLDGSAVHRNRLQLDAHHLFLLEVFEYPVQYAALGPAVHAGVDGMPVAKPGRQPPPFATMLGDVQDCVEHSQVRKADIAPLHWEMGRDTLKLDFGYFHARIVS